jgi:hypothetical protein
MRTRLLALVLATGALLAAGPALTDETAQPGSGPLADPDRHRTVRLTELAGLRQQADSLTERKRYAEAAAIYLGIDRDFADTYDESAGCDVLFNASIALEQARLAGLAIRVRRQLLERYPACSLAARTAVHLAHGYLALNMHREAVAQYEESARKYPKEREATDALINAFELRLAFGELGAAAADLHRFERNYARREPAESAALSLRFGLILAERGKWADARKQLQSYLKRYDPVIPLEERIRAELALADTHWEQRRPNRKAAVAGYKRVAAYLDRGAIGSLSDSWAASRAMTAVAKARYRLALVEYEKLAAIELPAFRPRKRVPPKIARWWKGRGREAEPDVIQFEYWSQHRFREWLDRQSAALRTVTDALREVAVLRSTEWTIAAAARLGDAHARFAETLETIVPPPSLARDQLLAEVFAKAMQPHVQQPRQLAFQSYEHCHRLALAAVWDGPDARHCRQRLTDLDPERYPPLDELRPPPDAGDPAVLPFPGPILERDDSNAGRYRRPLSPAQRGAIERYGNLLGGREPLAGLGEAELADPW